MRAVILAAGRGSRLHPYTDDRPKCLTVLGGVPLIDRQLRTLRAAGVDDVVIVTGYFSEQLALPGTRQRHNPNWSTTNMVESLFCAAQDFGTDIIVAYSDIVYEPRVLKALLDSPYPISVVVDRLWRPYWELRFGDPLRDAETLHMDDAGRIVEIGNKPASVAEIQAQYMGLMRFSGHGIAALRRARESLRTVRRPWMDKRPIEKAYMTDLLMEMIMIGDPVMAVPVEGGWLEIDTVDDYKITESMIRDGTIRRFYNPDALE